MSPLPYIMPHGKLITRPFLDGRVLSVTQSNADAFGRTRVSNPATVADCSCEYDKQPLIMNEDVAGTGVAAHSSDDASVVMSVGTASGDYVIRQSRQYCTYQKGKSQLVLATGALGVDAVGRESGMGYGDGRDGVFLVQRGNGPEILFRSSVTGSVVDTYIPQAEWNLHQYPGLDLTKSQILLIDFQWLGVGRVRVGLDADGEVLPLHEFMNDNRKPATYWRSGTLPVRYWIANSADTSAPGAMRQICWSVQSEGALETDRGFSWSVGQTTETGVTTRRPVLSIRPRTTFQGVENRAGVLPRSLELVADSIGAFVEIVHDPTLTGSSWADVDTTNSVVEYDTAATAISGGTVVWSGIVGSTGPKSSVIAEGGPSTLLWLTGNITGDTYTPLSIVATRLGNNGTSDIRSVLRWIEIR